MFSRKKYYIFLIIILIFSCQKYPTELKVHVIEEPKDFYLLSGQVTLPNGLPLPEVKVSIDNENIKKTFYTDSRGFFQISLDPGYYNVHAEKPKVIFGGKTTEYSIYENSIEITNHDFEINIVLGLKLLYASEIYQGEGHLNKLTLLRFDIDNLYCNNYEYLIKQFSITLYPYDLRNDLVYVNIFAIPDTCNWSYNNPGILSSEFLLNNVPLYDRIKCNLTNDPNGWSNKKFIYKFNKDFVLRYSKNGIAFVITDGTIYGGLFSERFQDKIFEMNIEYEFE